MALHRPATNFAVDRKHLIDPARDIQRHIKTLATIRTTDCDKLFHTRSVKDPATKGKNAQAPTPYLSP